MFRVALFAAEKTVFCISVFAYNQGFICSPSKIPQCNDSY